MRGSRHTADRPRRDLRGAAPSSLELIETIGGQAGLLSARCDVVRLEGGELAILKDYSRLPDPVRRAIGRVAARRERRAYDRLAGVAGVPRLLGTPGPFALLLERVDGVPLTNQRAVGNPVTFMAQLEILLARVHARGVSHGEIRLANVLAGRDGMPWLVDFAMASVVDPQRGSLLFRIQCRLDRYGWLMIKQHLVPGALTPGERAEQHRTRLLAGLLRHRVV